jgi:hypothetical protein
MYTYLRVYIKPAHAVCMYVCIIRMHVCTYVYMHVCVCVCVCVFVCVCVCVCV